MKATVLKVIEETKKVKTIVLESEEKINFKPGQFITILNENGDRRAYSISSPPGENISVTFKIYEKGTLSSFLTKLKEGDVIEIFGPFGHFYLEDDKAVFIGGGTGVAPFRSMALHCKNTNRNYDMLVSFSTEKDIIYKNEIRNLGDVIISSEQGRITKENLEKYDKNSIFYLCGPHKMVDSILEILKELKIPEENIRKERW